MDSLVLDLTKTKQPRPTEKMLKCLSTIDKWLNISIPAKCHTDYFECSQFLEDHLESAIKVAQASYDLSQARYRMRSSSKSRGYRGSQFDVSYYDEGGWGPHDIFDFGDFC